MTSGFIGYDRAYVYGLMFNVRMKEFNRQLRRFRIAVKLQAMMLSQLPEKLWWFYRT